MTNEQVMFFIGHENLYDHAHLSLKQRAVRFHRKFPEHRISEKNVREIMHRYGIMKKKVKVRSAPARKHLSIETYGEEILRLDNKVNKLFSEKVHFVFADECVFKARDFQM